MCLIIQDGLLFVYIPFGSMVKFQFLAQFPVNLFLYPIVSSLVLFKRKFAVFDRFVSITYSVVYYVSAL